MGRGSLAGPVVAAAVILPKNHGITELNDSKKLSSKKRSELFVAIKNKAISTGIGLVTAYTIDKINIRNATHMAMKYAIKNLNYIPDIVLIDGSDKLDIDIKNNNIIGGDALEESIMAASIYAKVSRDELMNTYAQKYPDFGFENNKGYGTKYHLNALKYFNPSPIHRMTFKPLKNKKSRIL